MKYGLSTSSSALTLTAICAVAGLAASASAQAQPAHQPDATMLRYPAVSKSHIAFVYANNIYLAPRAGGIASLTAVPPGQSSFPRFSPDGATLAFAANYDGNRDLYTLPVAGGTPFRVTHFPGSESLCSWTNDNRLMFLTSGLAGLGRQSQLYSVPATGGQPARYPMPYSGYGSVSQDGQSIAFTPHSTETRTWKRYRGGMATDIWVMNLKDLTSKKITDWEGTDSLPMWGKGSAASVIFYISDNGPEHRLNIWSFNTTTNERKQVTTFADDDVKWPSFGPGTDANAPGEIIFQLGSKIMLLDLASGKSNPVNISIPGAKPSIKSRSEDASRNISSAAISPTGKRVVLSGRGDIWSVPAKEGPARNLTNSSGVFERDPSWSPDGKWISYFSDESGEYELYIRAADAKAPGYSKLDDTEETDKKDADKKDADKDAKKDEPAKPDVTKDFKPTKLTTLGAGFRYEPTWSPDGKMIVFTDKAGGLFLVTLDWKDAAVTATVKQVDMNPDASRMGYSWTHDSSMLAYARTDETSNQNAIWIYNVKTGTSTRVTNPIFNNDSPAFDRKGDWLYYSTNRNFNSPRYADLDTTFAYINTGMIMAAPLRDNMKNPFAAKSDEEEWKKDDKAKDAKKDDKDKKDEKKDDKKDAASTADDGISGTWECQTTTPQGPLPFKLNISPAGEGKISITISSIMGSATAQSDFDKATGKFSASFAMGNAAVTIEGTAKDGAVSGTWSAGDTKGDFSGKRTDKGGDKADAKKDGDKDKKDDEKKPIKIDFENFEKRAIALPIAPGAFGNLEVNDSNKLIYARRGGDGAEGGIKIFDINDDSKEEKAVGAGGGFSMSADGKKLLVGRGSGLSIVDASAGGKSQSVTVTGLRVTVNPREEWRQIFTETWRLFRDFFYEPTMHGVDWPKMRDHYMQMIDDCSNREDVAYVQAELVSELNIGHAYINSPGDVASPGPQVAVGMLGCDWELDTSGAAPAYRIKTIYEGGPWDTDGKGPLSQPTTKSNKISEGDYILAVNGAPVDTTKDIYAAFIGTADKNTSLTVSSKPVIDDTAREVIIKPMGGEGTLRYRAWIEKNRKYVEEQSGGKIGYIYVPNTGVDGQNDLFRQYYGQRGMAGIIIDERWNGGGQIPTRFIELLNRPATNYWAKRDGQDWTWPPDSAQGHKAMLINGLAGSGGDMFPWLFKHNKIGKVFGMRTWGGLVGISGNPGLVDGGTISVPTFGFYETDGTWGVEGHGVDPDVEVIDDPGLTSQGKDPQLDAVIKHLQDEIAARPYTAPKRPTSPNRAGMGIKPEDK